MRTLLVVAAILIANPVWTAAAQQSAAGAAADKAAAENAREVDYATCRVAAYQAHASDIEDYVVSCMRVAGYRLEGHAEIGNAAFKAYCEGGYQPMTTNGRCDDQPSVH
ncbi:MULTISPECIES: hypothetical protein [unclassified Mesorhizobium]|uniref:hypothetical protein n=1 Tax=unclassified Mesorhizobium TaxID=325217 RepID=UPI00333609DB